MSLYRENTVLSYHFRNYNEISASYTLQSHKPLLSTKTTLRHTQDIISPSILSNSPKPSPKTSRKKSCSPQTQKVARPKGGPRSYLTRNIILPTEYNAQQNRSQRKETSRSILEGSSRDTSKSHVAVSYYVSSVVHTRRHVPMRDTFTHRCLRFPTLHPRLASLASVSDCIHLS